MHHKFYGFVVWFVATLFVLMTLGDSQNIEATYIYGAPAYSPAQGRGLV